MKYGNRTPTWERRVASHVETLSNRFSALSSDLTRLAEALKYAPTQPQFHVALPMETKSFIEAVHSVLEASQASYLSIDDVLVAMNSDHAFQTRENQTRVGMVLRKLGWTKIERRTKKPRYVYKRPPENRG